jgi:hypothetical protein
MKKTLSLFFILMISVLLVACEPPSVGDVAVVEPTINLSSATLNLTVGETKPLGVTVQGFAASELRYLSEDPSIASVNAAGNVTALKPGAVQVTASYQGLTQSVVVFVLPELSAVSSEPVATVVDVQLNVDGEVILVYSDGTLENTGLKAVIEEQSTTIQSAIVNAAGNLIITMSDGSTFNAGRVVGPSGPSGPTGPSGGGGTGAAGTPGVSVTNATITNGNLIFTLSNGTTINAGPITGGGSINQTQILTELGINVNQWNAIKGLVNLDLTETGLRALLGFTQEELDAIVDSQGLLSFNRYKQSYPGYLGSESTWITELIQGTLKVAVNVNLTSRIGDIYFPSGSTVSGLLNTDYVLPNFKTGGKLDPMSDSVLLSGTMYLPRFPESYNGYIFSDLQRTLINNIVIYGKGTLFNSMVQSGFAIADSGVAYVLKGALVNPSPDFPNAVSIFPNNPFNEYNNGIEFARWDVPNATFQMQNGLIRSASGVSIVMNNFASLQAVYQPINRSSLSVLSNMKDYYTKDGYEDLLEFVLENSGIIQSTLPQRGDSIGGNLGDLLIDLSNGVLNDFNGNPLNGYFLSNNTSIDYYKDFYTPMLGLNTSISPVNVARSTFANNQNIETGVIAISGVLSSDDLELRVETDIFYDLILPSVSFNGLIYDNVEGYYTPDNSFFPESMFISVYVVETIDLTLYQEYLACLESDEVECDDDYYLYSVSVTEPVEDDGDEVYIDESEIYVYQSPGDYLYISATLVIAVRLNLDPGTFVPEQYILNNKSNNGFDYYIDSLTSPVLIQNTGDNRIDADSFSGSDSKEFVIQYSSNVAGHTISGEIAGNDVRKWDVFYVILSSSGVFKDSGILESSGFAFGGSGLNTSATNSGFIQISSPFDFAARQNATGFVTLSEDGSVLITAQQSVSLFGVTYTNQTTVGGTLDPRTYQSSPVLIATMSGLTIDEGDVVFIRSEVNYVNSVEINRYALVQDSIVPTLSGVLLVSDSVVSPFVAKAGDKIRIVVASNEPIVPVLNIPYDADKTGYIFKSSGFVLTSGFTSTTKANEDAGIKAASGLVEVDGSRYTTITYNHLIVPIGAQDTEEGYFNFGNIRFKDRADNSGVIQSSDFQNKVWIDPIPPVVSVSGITVSGVTTTDPSSGISVSGIIDLNFLITETFNNVTLGQVRYSGIIQASGINSTFGAGLNASSGLWSALQQGDTNTDNELEFDYLIDTMNLYNGEYKIIIYALDYVGNETEFVFSFVVENELEFIGIIFNSGVDPLVTPLTEFSMVFNIPVTMSGVAAGATINNILRFEMNSTVDNDVTSSFTENNIIFVGIDPSNNKVLKFTLPTTISFSIAKPYEVEVKILLEEYFSDFNETVEVNGPQPVIKTDVPS